MKADTVPAAELCAGYSGLFLAARLAGWPVELEWLSEVDADASKVLAHHHPDVPNLGDMTAADWERVEKVDVLAGGIPCQGWSLAGKRNGSGDERDLWPVRKFDDDGNPRRGAVDAIRALRPRVFLLENVASLVSAEQGRPFATILTDLHELGYNAGWVTVGACRVGACHHRHRVFLIATLTEVVPPEGLLFGFPLSAAAKWPTSGLMTGGQVWPLNIGVCRAPGDVVLLPTPTARITDNRGTPSAETAQHRMNAGRRNLEDAIALLPTVTARDASRGAGRKDPEGRPLSEVIALLPDGRFGQYEDAVRFHEIAFGASAPEPVEPGRLGRPRLSPAFTQWMQMLPAGWLTDVVDRKAAIKLAGNGVNPTQGALAIRLLAPYMPNLMPTPARLGVAA